MNEKRCIETDLVHSGEEEKIEGSVVLPVFQSATYLSAGETEYEEIRYLRLNNSPNHRVLHAKLAAVCGGEAAIVTSSGMAAIAATLMGLLKAGDRLLAQSCLYGGTHSLFTGDLPDFGLQVDFIDGNRPDTWEKAATAETRAIYVETMTNPLLEVADLEAVTAFARERGLTSIIDNTFGTPVNYRPLQWGFDVEIHSATKYLNGHSDIVAGCVVADRERIARIGRRLGHFGATLDPHACFLLHRGMKTMALRVRHQNASAAALAGMLERCEAVSRVNYPGLASHPRHERASRLFSGCGGVLSFELRGGQAAAERLLERLQIPASAPSLGGVETLITRPATSSHAGLSEAERQGLGIGSGLVRVAVGIESAADLIDDFEQGLAEV